MKNLAEYYARLLSEEYPEAARQIGTATLKQYEEKLPRFEDYYGAPAKYFENILHMEGIAGNWKMPEGYSERTLQQELKQREYLGVALGEVIHKMVHEGTAPIEVCGSLRNFADWVEADTLHLYENIWQDLVKANGTALSKIPISAGKKDLSDCDVYLAVNGVISQFNADDIAFFLRNANEQGALKNSARYKRQLATLGDAPLGWDLSPQTIEKVRKQINGRTLTLGKFDDIANGGPMIVYTAAKSRGKE